MNNLEKLITAFLMMLTTGLVAASDSVNVKVDSEYAKFYIPLEVREPYRRFKPETPDGGLEYAIAVVIGTSQLGHYLYKYPGAAETKDSLQALLARGQKSVWVREDGSESVSDRHSVDVYYSAPHVVISITNPATLELLEGHDRVTIFVHGFESAAAGQVISIETGE